MNNDETTDTDILRSRPEPIDPPSPAVARALLRRGPSKAFARVIACLDESVDDDKWFAVVDLLAADTTVTDRRFETLLDSDQTDYDLRRAAAHVLSRRGVVRGDQVLFDEFASRALADRFIDDGPSGIRRMCRAIGMFYEPDVIEVTDRMAARRRMTEATVYELADDPDSGGDHVAARVLGHWDEPRPVETLLRIADDPARREEVRDIALDMLCRLQAPEAIELIGRALLDATRDDAEREHFAWVLGEIGNFAGLEPLEAAFAQDPEGYVGQRAREAIERIRSCDTE